MNIETKRLFRKYCKLQKKVTNAKTMKTFLKWAKQADGAYADYVRSHKNELPK